MKQLSLIFILVAFFSCKSENSKDSSTKLFTLEIKDSIQIDYLGNLNVFDFDPESGLYLGIDHDAIQIILFDEKGKSHHQYALKNDGPNAINWLQGKSFLDGMVSILDSQKGLIQFDTNGEISRKIEMPLDYLYLNGLNFSAYPLAEKYAYIRPERDMSDYSNTSVFYKRIYSSPILEVFDPESGEISNTMEFPPNTIYEDGNFYHWMFPTVENIDGKWYLYFLAERKYHVYEEKADEVIYSKTVDLNITDAEDLIGVPIENPELINQQAEPNIFGRIEGLYPMSNYTVVIYTKGVKKEVSNQYDPEKMEEWMEFIESIPRFAAILDKKDSLIQKDILLPTGLLFNGVYNNKNEIFALKNQDYFGEEEKVTFYKLRLEK